MALPVGVTLLLLRNTCFFFRMNGIVLAKSMLKILWKILVSVEIFLVVRLLLCRGREIIFVGAFVALPFAAASRVVMRFSFNLKGKV